MEEIKISELIKKQNISATDKLVAEDEDGTKSIEFRVIKNAITADMACETINKLKALTVAEGMLINTLGYHKENDGGAGTYMIEYDPASADDNGLCHYVKTSDTLRAKLIHNGVISVMQFGAVGDGIHDDYTAIQKAINSGLDVYFPNKKYKLTSSLSIPSNTVLNFNGATLICPNAVPFRVGEETISKNITIQNVIINGIGVASIGNKSSSISLDNIKYSNDGYNSTYWAVGIFSCDNISIRNCSLLGCKAPAIQMPISISVDDNSLPTIGLNISNCIIQSSAGQVISLQAFCSAHIPVNITNTSIIGDTNSIGLDTNSTIIAIVDSCKFTKMKYAISQSNSDVSISNSVFNNCNEVIKSQASNDTLALSGMIVFENSTASLPIFTGRVSSKCIFRNKTSRSIGVSL